MDDEIKDEELAGGTMAPEVEEPKETPEEEPEA